MVSAYNHLLVLADSDTLSLDDLNVVKTRQDFMLDLESGCHAELDTLLDLEWLVLECSLRTLGREINGDRRTTFGVHGQGDDDAVAGIVGV